VRRVLVLIALSFWQGGFTFYAAVVVPVGTEVLNSTLRQGFITRRVTHYLNLTAAVALVVLGWEVLASRDPAQWRRRACRGVWVFAVLCQGLLFWLHPRLDSLLRVKGRLILDREAFRPQHQLYLWTHTLQWATALAFLVLCVWGWRAADAKGGERGTSTPC